MNAKAHIAFIQRHGLLAWTIWALYEALDRFFAVRQYIVYTVDPVTGATTDRAEFPIRTLSAAELAALVDAPEWDITADFLTRASALGHVCRGAFDGDRLCVYAWYSTGKADWELGTAIQQTDGRTDSFKHFTHPTARGKGYQRALLSAALRSNTCGILTAITVGNYASRRSVSALGARVVGSVIFAGRDRGRHHVWHRVSRRPALAVQESSTQLAASR